ncbi:MAG: hypothetical protein LIO97_07105 [Tannerellaceae bacterium]|nr:hypothetical protein [Tannerellaceae bacterium]
MHTIGKVTVRFQMQDKSFARVLYSRWDTFFYNCIEKVLDRVINQNSPVTDMPEIEELILNLGSIPEDKLEQWYPELLKEKLTQALLPYLPTEIPTETIEQAGNNYLLEILCLYLLHGRLPWHIHLTYPTISRLFLAALQVAASGLKTFLLTYGHYNNLQQRLVIQLGRPGTRSRYPFTCSPRK